MTHFPTLSIVAPIYNEAGNLTPLIQEIEVALKDYPADWEIILVDDGSTDGSQKEIQEIAKTFTHVKPLFLKRNFGQTAALSAGIDASSGEVIVTIDADRQNDPADIMALLNKMTEGYDVVSGWRKARKDHFLTRTLPSRLANKLISFFTGVPLHDYGCSLKAYTRETISSFRLYGEMHRFLPALCTWRGAKVAEIPVNHRPRTQGVSKYGLNRTFRVLLDLLTVKFLLEYSTKPMRVFGTAGFLFTTAGLAISLYLTSLKLIAHENIGQRPLLFLGILLIIVGLQLIMLGLISELLVRIYYESQNKTVYQIDTSKRR
jgi:glycosyltransferase involved in cell wall biosynthesis